MYNIIVYFSVSVSTLKLYSPLVFVCVCVRARFRCIISSLIFLFLLHSVLLCNNVAINFQGNLPIFFFKLFIVNRKYSMEQVRSSLDMEKKERLGTISFYLRENQIVFV